MTIEVLIYREQPCEPSGWLTLIKIEPATPGVQNTARRVRAVVSDIPFVVCAHVEIQSKYQYVCSRPWFHWSTQASRLAREL